MCQLRHRMHGLGLGVTKTIDRDSGYFTVQTTVNYTVTRSDTNKVQQSRTVTTVGTYYVKYYVYIVLLYCRVLPYYDMKLPEESFRVYSIVV